MKKTLFFTLLTLIMLAGCIAGTETQNEFNKKITDVGYITLKYYAIYLIGVGIIIVFMVIRKSNDKK